MVVLVGAILAVTLEPRLWLFGNHHNLWNWQIGAGLALLTIYLHQWRLLWNRWHRQTTNSAQRSREHCILGVVMTALFASHAQQIGYGLTAALSGLFIATAIVGAFSRKTVGSMTKLQLLLWTGLHVALGAMMAPLIAIHIWVALAYQ
jgi:hypothetical protein